MVSQGVELRTDEVLILPVLPTRCHVLGCDNKALKKVTLSPRSEESSRAVEQLVERVSSLQRELEQRHSQEETEQVQTSQLGGWLGGFC